MEEISLEKFIEFIKNDNTILQSKIINFRNEDNNGSDLKLFLKNNKYIKSCIFNNVNLNFYHTPEEKFILSNNKLFGITYEDCNFNNCVIEYDNIDLKFLNFKNCSLDKISLKSVKINNFSIIDIKFYHIKKIDTINIESSTIKNITIKSHITNVNINTTIVEFFNLHNCKISKLNLISCWIKNFHSFKSDLQEFIFTHCSNKLINNIKNINFNTTYIDEIDLNGGSIEYFEIGEFSNKINLIHILSVDIKVLKLYKLHIEIFRLVNLNIKTNSYKFEMQECIIFKNFLLNKYNLKEITIENSNLLSFNEFNTVRCNTISLDKNYIDKIKIIDLDIKKYNDLNLGTIALLKKYYNSIGDFTKEVFYNKIEKNKLLKIIMINFKKKNKSKSSLIIDFTILGITKLFSEHGTNFVKSIFLTLIFSFVFYNILYGYQVNFNLCSIFEHKFWNGYFKFLIITDYSNPVYSNNQKKYFDDQPGLWIPNILGKIAIAFGIYETIKSFRKYHK